MILVDTSVIVAWLDRNHPQHSACVKIIEHWARRDRLAVSSVTYGELAAGGRTREAVEKDLHDFEKIPLDTNATGRAGMAFRQYRRKDSDDSVRATTGSRGTQIRTDVRNAERQAAQNQQPGQQANADRNGAPQLETQRERK